MTSTDFFLICSLDMPEFNVPQQLACITCKMQVQYCKSSPCLYTHTHRKILDKCRLKSKLLSFDVAFGAVLDFPEVLSLRRRDFAVLQKYEAMHLQYNWISNRGLNPSSLQSCGPPGDQHPDSKDFLYTMT